MVKAMVRLMQTWEQPYKGPGTVVFNVPVQICQISISKTL